MATRALVGFITDKPELIATYNHYDGYPENLGAGLDKFYSEPNEALKIASLGYISYMDPENGEIEAKHKEAPSKVNLSGMGFEDAMYEIAKEADSFGADYIYIYDSENMEWVDVKMYGINQAAETLMQALMPMGYELFGPNIKDLPAAPDQYVDESYSSKWKKFLNNEGMDMPGFEGTLGQLNNLSLYQKKPSLSQVMSQAFYQLQDEPGELLSAYKDSLANDIRINGEKQYADYTVEDFIEDYNNYVSDKMDY